MIADLPPLDTLPRQNASHVKNRWGDVVRQVRQSGSVAVTSHSAIEMVLLDAGTYRQLVDGVQALRSREQAVLDELSGRFDARLVALQQPEAVGKVKALLEARGSLRRRPKAGASF